jgi:hypothetical protein
MRWKRGECGRGLAIRPVRNRNVLAVGSGYVVVVVAEMVVVAITIIWMGGRVGIAARVLENRNRSSSRVMRT